MNWHSRKHIRVGLIGAGAIARQAYLPLLKDLEGLRLTAIVEPDQRIIADLSREFRLAYLGPDLDAALAHVDAVIICTPNYLHYPIARACLEQGKHILCEKPVTTKVEDCENLLQMASSNALSFTVGHVRRFYPAVKRIKEIVAGNLLGHLIGFDFREGTVFNWPTASGYIFDREKAGGGVLLDIGVHLLDLLLYWLANEPVQVDYADDTLGGIEAFADMRIVFSNGVTGHVRLSRLSVLRNIYELVFEKGRLQWSPFHPGSLCVRRNGRKPEFITSKNENPTRALLADFTAAILQGRQPEVTLTEALRTLRLIDYCYRTRKPLPLD